jgi:Carbohydrate binding module (family 6)
VEERPGPALIRPYVHRKDDEPAVAQPALSAGPSDTGVLVHRATESVSQPAAINAAPPTGSELAVRPGLEPVADARPGTALSVSTSHASHLRVRSGAHRSGEGTSLVLWWPVARKRRRIWFIAASSALAAVILIALVSNESTTRPVVETDAASIPGWFAPGSPDVGVPAPAPEGSLPQGVDSLVTPPDGVPGIPGIPGIPAAVPGSPALSVPASNPAPAPAGSPSTLPPTPARTTPAAPKLSAYDTILGETFDDRYSIEIEPDESGSGVHIGFIHRGDWVSYDDLEFTDVPATKMLISACNWAADGKTGLVEVYLDSLTNAPIGRMTIPNNSSWSAFKTYSMSIQPTTGKHRVYLKFAATHSVEFANVDWFRFQH